MGFFDFLRKKQVEEKEQIKFEELENWLKNKQKSNEDREKELLSLMKQRISEFVVELEKGIAVLKNINLEEKRAEDRARFIVKENLDNYIFLLSKLAGSLKHLDEKTYGAFIERINSLFVDFEKKSFVNFQKATFLIGKEFEDIKKSMGNFFKDLKNIFENNKNLIENSKAVSFLLSKYNETGSIEKIKSNIHDAIKKTEQKKADLENQIKITEKNIEQMTKSEEYANQLKKREEVKKKKSGLKQDILTLKEFIDLKSLARAFHENEKKMKIVRRYNEAFDDIFETDGADLLNLIEEPKRKQLIEKINEIKRKQDELVKFFAEKDETEPLKAEIEKIRAEIEAFDEEKADGLKRIQKLDEKKKEFIAVIKAEIAKLKVEIV